MMAATCATRQARWWEGRGGEGCNIRNSVDSLYQGLAGLLTHLLNLLAAPPGAHGPGVAVVVLLLLELDVGAVARYYDGAAALPAAEARARQLRGVLVHMAGLVLLADRRARRGGAHVVWVRRASVVVDGERRKGSSRRHAGSSGGGSSSISGGRQRERLRWV